MIVALVYLGIGFVLGAGVMLMWTSEREAADWGKHLRDEEGPYDWASEPHDFPLIRVRKK